MAKITFKKHPRATGLSAIGYPNQSVDIKLGGKVVGIIAAPNWQTKDNLYRARFATKTDDHERDGAFKWVELRHKTETEGEMRDYLREHQDRISRSFEPHYLED